MHVGAVNTGASDRRKNAATLIGAALVTVNMTRAAGADPLAPVRSWTDAAGTSTGSGSDFGTFLPTAPASLATAAITVPAGTVSKVARFLIGAYYNGAAGGTIKLRATLSDASATELLITVPGGATFDRTYYCYEFTYQAAAAAQTLTLKLEIAGGSSAESHIGMVTYK